MYIIFGIYIRNTKIINFLFRNIIYFAKIININVLEQKETPGLGTKMTDEGNVLLASFKDKNASEINMTVKKDGGDVDALTAATISSRAYAEAVAVAYEAFKVACGWQSEAGDVATGASQQAEKGGNNE